MVGIVGSSAISRNYTVSEQECLVTVMAIKKFRSYIEGHQFEVITDHASLKWLINQLDLNGRLARWALKLQGFNFTIRHRKGSQNIVPDSLSRMYSEDNSEINLVDEFWISEMDNSMDIDLDSDEFGSPDYIE